MDILQKTVAGLAQCLSFLELAIKKYLILKLAGRKVSDLERRVGFGNRIDFFHLSMFIAFLFENFSKFSCLSRKIRKISDFHQIKKFHSKFNLK